MADKTAQMASLVADPDRTALHIVTIAEELPVNEALQLLVDVEQSRDVPPGAFLVNHCVQRLFTDAVSQTLHTGRLSWRATDDEATAALVAVASRRETRERAEEEQRARLHGFGLPVIACPEILSPAFGRAEINRLAQLLPQAFAAPGAA